LLEAPARGTVRITDRGKQVLANRPPRIDIRFLSRFPEFQEFRASTRPPRKESVEETLNGATPEEEIESIWRTLRDELAEELLTQVKNVPPSFFERLVVDLLVAMGYGGSRIEAAESVGRSGDGGIDGIIKEDKLGLDAVYVQAKRWDGAVGRPTVQGFAGSLEGVRARKGVLITTSSFTREAYTYVEHIEKRIVLIDGPQLVRLMIDHHVGVSTVRIYDVKRVDTDYFEVQ
jgi:restriction system protein